MDAANFAENRAYISGSSLFCSIRIRREVELLEIGKSKIASSAANMKTRNGRPS